MDLYIIFFCSSFFNISLWHFSTFHSSDMFDFYQYNPYKSGHLYSLIIMSCMCSQGWRDGVMQSWAPSEWVTVLVRKAIAAVYWCRLKKSNASRSSLSNHCCLATGPDYVQRMWNSRRNATLLGGALWVCVFRITLLKLCVFVCVQGVHSGTGISSSKKI